MSDRPIAPAREPLNDDLKDLASCLAFAYSEVHDDKDVNWNVSNVARKLYERYRAKITSGELRVVKKATNEHTENHINTRTFYCSNCHIHTERVFRYAPTGSPRTVKFCPGCGSEILPL